MTTPKAQCYRDAEDSLSECRKLVNKNYATCRAAAMAEEDAKKREAKLKECKELLKTGYENCKNAEKEEKEACDTLYP
jgi:hypothetical protein